MSEYRQAEKGKKGKKEANSQEQVSQFSLFPQYAIIAFCIRFNLTAEPTTKLA